MTALKKVYEIYNDKMCLCPFLGGFYQTFNNSNEPRPSQIRACSLIKTRSENLITNGSILETMNSPEWQQLRRDFVEGRFEQLDQCKICVNAERHGGASGRHGSNQYFADNTSVDLVEKIQEIIDNDYKIKTLSSIDYFPTNYCNYSCVMCYGAASTSRRTFEIQVLKKDIPALLVNEPEEDFWEILKTVEIINFTGGETQLQPEVHKLIDYLVENDLAKNISIYLLTNASNYPESLIEKFHRFRRVLYMCSIDGVGNVIEYQRRGAQWSDVERNTLRLVRHGSISTVINHVFSSINALNFMDFADWIFENQVEFVSLSHVFNCDHFGVASLPPELRQIAIERLDAGLAKYAHNTEHAYVYTRKYIAQARDMIENTPHNPEMTRRFVQAIRQEDLASSRRLVDVVPEWRPYFVDNE